MALDYVGWKFSERCYFYSKPFWILLKELEDILNYKNALNEFKKDNAKT